MEGFGPGGDSPGHKRFAAAVPTYGADIAYRLKTAVNEQTRIVIQDVTGDTTRTLSGPSSAGVHRVTWDFRGKTPPPPALSPAGKRDSTIAARRLDFVFDSLGKAGKDTTALGRFKRVLLGGDMQQVFQAFGGGGGGTAAGMAAAAGISTLPRPSRSSSSSTVRAAAEVEAADSTSESVPAHSPRSSHRATTWCRSP